jgi:hypothetical protein
MPLSMLYICCDLVQSGFSNSGVQVPFQWTNWIFVDPVWSGFLMDQNQIFSLQKWGKISFTNFFIFSKFYYQKYYI